VRLEIGRSVLLPPREARRDQQTKSSKNDLSW